MMCGYWMTSVPVGKRYATFPLGRRRGLAARKSRLQAETRLKKTFVCSSAAASSKWLEAGVAVQPAGTSRRRSRAATCRRWISQQLQC